MHKTGWRVSFTHKRQ